MSSGEQTFSTQIHDTIGLLVILKTLCPIGHSRVESTSFPRHFNSIKLKQCGTEVEGAGGGAAPGIVSFNWLSSGTWAM